MVYQHFMGYLMPKFDSFLNVWLQLIIYFVKIHCIFLIVFLFVYNQGPEINSFFQVLLILLFGLLGRQISFFN